MSTEDMMKEISVLEVLGINEDTLKDMLNVIKLHYHEPLDILEFINEDNIMNMNEKIFMSHILGLFLRNITYIDGKVTGFIGGKTEDIIKFKFIINDLKKCEKVSDMLIKIRDMKEVELSDKIIISVYMGLNTKLIPKSK